MRGGRGVRASADPRVFELQQCGVEMRMRSIGNVGREVRKVVVQVALDVVIACFVDAQRVVGADFAIRILRLEVVQGLETALRNESR